MNLGLTFLSMLSKTILYPELMDRSLLLCAVSGPFVCEGTAGSDSLVCEDTAVSDSLDCNGAAVSGCEGAAVSGSWSKLVCNVSSASKPSSEATLLHSDVESDSSEESRKKENITDGDNGDSGGGDGDRSSGDGGENSSISMKGMIVSSSLSSYSKKK